MAHETSPERPPLMPLVEGILDDADIKRLFAELATHAWVLEILAKSGPRNHATQDQVSLDIANRLLRTGTVRAIQVRYLYDGAEWTDTLIRLPHGMRLVRCRDTVSALGG